MAGGAQSHGEQGTIRALPPFWSVAPDCFRLDKGVGVAVED